jgi:hypothetical protein
MDAHIRSAGDGTLFVERFELLGERPRRSLEFVANRASWCDDETSGLRVVASIDREFAVPPPSVQLQYFVAPDQIPSLRNRPEALPWLVWHELERLQRELVASAAFVNECMDWGWPGNVPELQRAVRAAAARATREGVRTLLPRHLS